MDKRDNTITKVGRRHITVTKVDIGEYRAKNRPWGCYKVAGVLEHHFGFIGAHG